MKLIPRLILAAILCTALVGLTAFGQRSGKSSPKKNTQSAVRERERERDRPGGISEDEGEEVLQREQFIHDRRAGGPGKTIAPDAYAKAIQELSRVKASKGERSIFSAPIAWQNVNDGGMKYTPTIYVSGRCNSIAADPTDPTILYLGTAGGGVWKSTDGGLNWTPKTDNQTTMSSGAVAVDPLHPQTIFWATGEQNYSLDSYFGDGVFKSTDGGDTWSKIATSAFGSYFSTIRIHPTNPSLMYIAGANGVFRSTNGGSSWTNTNAGSGVNCLIMNPSNPSTLYITIGSSGDNTIKKSTNGGNSWTTLSWPASTAGRCQLAIAPSDTTVLYAGCDISGAVGGIYRSSDAGVSWTRQNGTIDYMSAQAWYDNAITVVPTDANSILVGGLDVYSSSNGGVTLTKRTNWTSSSATVFTHADIHSLTYIGSTLYCLSDGGAFKSTDNGTTWKDMNKTLNTLQYQGADYDAFNTSTYSGGMQDNGKSRTTDNGNVVTQVWGGDGGYTIIDGTNSLYYYSQYVNGTVERSSDSGLSYTRIQPTGTGGLFYNPFEIAPGDPNTMVYAQNDVWITNSIRTASSLSWTRVGSVSLTGGSAVSAIGISNTNTNKIYIGASNGIIYTTSNGGSSWVTKSGFSYVSDLVVDKVNDNIAYGVFGGGGTHVAKTTDGGVNWTNISGDLPNVAVNSIVIRQTAPRLLIVGTDIGVFSSANEGTTWTELGTGLPICAIFDLKYKEGPKILLAATHGRGLWTLDLNQLAFGVDPYALAFGLVGGGSSKTDTVTVTNGSGNTINISSVTSSNPAFTVTPTSGAVTAGNSMDFVVTFTPRTYGAVSTNLSFVNDGPTSPDLVGLSGTGLYGAFSSNKASINYAKVRVGATKPDTIKVTNPGNATLHISGISSTIPEFQVTTVVDSIAAGANKSFPVTFAPSSADPFSGAIIFATDEFAAGDTIPVSGQGAVATISVNVLRDLDGDLGTTGDQVPKQWALKVYKDSVSVGTLVEQVVASSYDFQIVTAGTYIVSEVDSGTTWVRANGNHSAYDTFTVANNQSVSSTFINKYFTVPMAFTSRWNLVSAPITRNNYSISVIYPTSSSSLFRFDTTTGYQEGFAFTPGVGYWLKFDANLADTLYGSPLPAQVLPVAAGWNLIGMISSPLSPAAVAQLPADNVQSVYWGYADGYKMADVLEPGRGYWVKVAGSGTLTLDPQNAGRAIPKISNIVRSLASVTIVDAKGGKQTLYFDLNTKSGVTEQTFAMPPAPPAGSFDVRFASQSAAAFFDNTSSARIQIAGAVYPLTVTWDLAGSAQTWSLTDGKSVAMQLDRSSRAVTIKDPSVKTLTLSPSVAAIPATYALGQNYPNPFNPSTVIKYQIPEESRVTLKVFNALGQEIRTLVNGVQDAGYKQMEWSATDNDGNALPSGLYLYRLEASSTTTPSNSFTQVMKMMLVK